VHLSARAQIGTSRMSVAEWLMVTRRSPQRIALQYSDAAEARLADLYSAAARPSSNSGRAAKTFIAMSLSARANFGKSRLLESVASSR
jgi:hypothetical protein